ncbi:MAG: chemotaxis protein CheW [Pseudomonadota bacterium]
MMEEKSVLASTKEKQQIIQLIVFRVGDEEFGVPINAVQEIIKIGNITPIPDSPDFIRGLINVRGDIVAIIDVRARFSLPTEEEPSKHIVIVKQEGNLFGLMVNEVMEVLRIQESDIKAPPQLMAKIQEDYVYGVITHDSRLIILLDVTKVLSEDELIRLASLTHQKQNKNSFEEETLGESKLTKKKNNTDLTDRKKT